MNNEQMPEMPEGLPEVLWRHPPTVLYAIGIKAAKDARTPANDATQSGAHEETQDASS